MTLLPSSVSRRRSAGSGTDAVDLVAHLQVQVRIRKERHAGAKDPRNVDAVHLIEREVPHSHAVELLPRDEDRARREGRLFAREIHARLFSAEKGRDGKTVLGFGDDAKNVPLLHDRLGRGTRKFPARENAAADERASREFADRTEGLSRDRGVRDFDVKEDRFAVVFLLFGLPVLVFLGEVDRKDLAKEHRAENRSDDAERIGASVCDRDVFTFVVKKVERLLRRAEAGGVRDGPVVDAQHLRQRHPVPEQKPERDRHDDPEKDDHEGEKIQNQSAAFEGREKGRSHLQSHEEDEERETEVADEKEHGLGHREAEVACGESHEENEGYAERNPRHLDAPEKRAEGDDERVDQNDVRHGIRVGKERAKPIHEKNQKKKIGGILSKCDPSPRRDSRETRTKGGFSRRGRPPSRQAARPKAPGRPKERRRSVCLGCTRRLSEEARDARKPERPGPAPGP